MSAGRRSVFTRFAQWASDATGRPGACIAAALLIVAWALSGPWFGFDDTWQLVINTTTTVITFLMVFLIQHTQNRDTHALQIKLDELIRVTRDADTALLDLEELDDVELQRIRAAYEALAAEARERPQAGEGPDSVASAPAPTGAASPVAPRAGASRPVAPQRGTGS